MAVLLNRYGQHNDFILAVIVGFAEIQIAVMGIEWEMLQVHFAIEDNLEHLLISGPMAGVQPKCERSFAAILGKSSDKL